MGLPVTSEKKSYAKEDATFHSLIYPKYSLPPPGFLQLKELGGVYGVWIFVRLEKFKKEIGKTFKELIPLLKRDQTLVLKMSMMTTVLFHVFVPCRADELHPTSAHSATFLLASLISSYQEQVGRRNCTLTFQWKKPDPPPTPCSTHKQGGHMNTHGCHHYMESELRCDQEFNRGQIKWLSFVKKVLDGSSWLKL